MTQATPQTDKKIDITGVIHVNELQGGEAVGVKVAHMVVNNYYSDRGKTSDGKTRKGAEAHLLCDRTDQSSEFRKTLIQSYTKDLHQKAHFFLVTGARKDCLKSFVRRLVNHEIKQVLVKQDKQEIEVASENISWERSHEKSLDDWLDLVHDKFGSGNLFTFPIEERFPRFQQNLQAYDLVVIRHHLRAEEWRESSCQLAKEYIKLFDTLETNETSKNRVPHFVVIFVVEKSAGFGGFAPFDTQDKVVRQLLEAFQSCDNKQGKLNHRRISALPLVTKTDVDDTIGDSNPDDWDPDIEDQTKKVFRFGRKMASMEQVYTEIFKKMDTD